MERDMPAVIARLVALLALTRAVACSNAAAPPLAGMGGTGVVRCTSDLQCTDGACLGGNCISRTSIAPAWAIEIRPSSGSTAPLTEWTDLDGAAACSH